MPRFFVKNEQIKDNEITILGEDVKHIANVLRLKKEDEIQICNLDTKMNYIANINEIDKKYVKCKIKKIENTNSEIQVNITLYQGLPKADKMEYIIQKNVALGEKKIIPVEMERSIVKFDQKTVEKKIERWQKISEVASKQSGRDIIPKIEIPTNIKKICENINEYDIVLVAYENEEDNTLKTELQKIKKTDNLKIAIIIGPEGGIDKKEILQLKEVGAKTITLGQRILRTETASIVVISNIIYELEMKKGNRVKGEYIIKWQIKKQTKKQQARQIKQQKIITK